MTGQERYNELYDELENIVKNLHESFEYGRHFPALNDGRGIDQDILIHRVTAMNDVAQEMRMLRKFRGSGLVK